MISSRAVKNLLATLFWVAAWYLLAVAMGNPLLLPTPVQVLRRLGELAGTGAFWRIAAVSIGRILLGAVSAMALGAVLAVDRRGLSYGKELAAVLAGPAANLLSTAVLARMGLETAAGVHMVLGAFNLLPIRPLDGGRALYLGASWLLGPAAGEAAARWTGTAAALALVAGLSWLMVQSGGSLWLLPAAVGALTAAGRECFGK